MCMKSFTFTVNYKVELYDPKSGGFMPSSPGIGMHVEARDPDDKTILSRVSDIIMHHFIITIMFFINMCIIM
jgi:hypothetical protein